MHLTQRQETLPRIVCRTALGRRWIGRSSVIAAAHRRAATLLVPATSPTAGRDDKSITLYSGRSEALVKPLLDRFTQKTGHRRRASGTASTAQMAAQLRGGGRQDARRRVPGPGRRRARRGQQDRPVRARCPPRSLEQGARRVPGRGRQWVGVTGRSRVLVYNPTLVPAADLPTSVFDLTDPKWKGKVGIAPTNGSFQAFVTGVRVQHGEDKAKEFFDRRSRPTTSQIRENNIADRRGRRRRQGARRAWSTTTTSARSPRSAGITPDKLKAKLHFFARRRHRRAGQRLRGRRARPGPPTTRTCGRCWTTCSAPRRRRYFAAADRSNTRSSAGAPGAGLRAGAGRAEAARRSTSTTSSPSRPAVALIKESGLAP